MTLQDYPITFPYGVTTNPYTPSHPHRGDDRACPKDTPIVICGVTIGFVGMTGMADGYHCHNQEWQGSKTNVRKPKNAFKGGTVIEVDPIGNTGDGTWGKYVTVRNDDGWNSSYCHMNTTNAKVGQVLKEGSTDMYQEEKVNEGDAVNIFRFFGYEPNANDKAAAVKRGSWKQWIYKDVLTHPAVKDAVSGNGEYTDAGTVDGKPVYRKVS